jgi:hypothetical protein
MPHIHSEKNHNKHVASSSTPGARDLEISSLGSQFVREAAIETHFLRYIQSALPRPDISPEGIFENMASSRLKFLKLFERNMVGGGTPTAFSRATVL